MINAVLQRLDALQAELATLDPTHEIDVADRVAAMAKALRDVAAAAQSRPQGASARGRRSQARRVAA